MGKIIAFAYGLASYAIFFSSFLYSIGFLKNQVVPKSIDSGVPGPRGEAFAIDVLLLGLFAVQHSVMARKGFKRWWTRYVPEQVERSTYVLLSGLVFFLLFWQWRPMTDAVWNIQNPLGEQILTALFWGGWGFVVLGSSLVDHFDLFGLRQVYLHLAGRERTPIGFKTPFLYRIVRHPIMLGYVVAFWSSSQMTAGHFLFAAVMTLYIVIGTRLEERSLVRQYGPAYEEYRRRVPMLLPIPKRR